MPTPKAKKLKPNAGLDTLKEMIQYIHSNVMAMNQSKIFAGLIIIVLNISSKFVTIKLSKPLEGYLKYTFSRDILVFAMAWMGTRDIYIALLITILFVIATDYLFHEESAFFMLPESFKDHHLSLLENDGGDVTDEDYVKAKKIVERYTAQNPKEIVYENFSMK
jgi:hypothetical protein